MKTKITEYNIRLLSHKDKVRFALFCAKQVKYKIKDIEGFNCIRMVEKWLDGKATSNDCRIAADLAYDVANGEDGIGRLNAEQYATYTSYCATHVTMSNNASGVCHTAEYARNTISHNTNNAKEEQEKYLYELIHLDDIVEKELLGG